MSNRTAKFVSAVFAGFLAGGALTTMSSSAARAADDCLSGPKDQTPPGGHWYYRIDPATKRHCWYLREENEKLSRAAPQSSTPLPTPVAPRQEATARSIADARAELPLPQTRIDTPNRADTLLSGKPADTALIESSRRANVPNWSAQRSIVAARWPEQSGASPSADPISNKADPAKGVEPTSRVPPPPVRAAGQFAAANLSLETPAYSVQIQSAALLGALVLMGIMGGIVFKFGGQRNSRHGKVRARRGRIWEPTTDDDRIRLLAHAGAHDYGHRSSFARDLDRAKRNDRITEFFSQLSRHAPA